MVDVKKEEVVAPKVALPVAPVTTPTAVTPSPPKVALPVAPVTTPVAATSPAQVFPPKTPSSPSYSNYSSAPVDNSSKKLWFVVGGVTLLIIILLVGGYFAVKVISSGSNSSSESNLTLIPTTQGANEEITEVNNGSGRPSIPHTDNNVSLGFVDNNSGAEVPPVNGSSVPSLQDLLNEANETGDGVPSGDASGSLSVSVTSLACGASSFVLDLLVNSGSFDAIVFHVKDSTNTHPFSEMASLSAGQSHTFNLDMAGKTIDLGSASVEVYSWSSTGDESLLTTRAC